MKNKFFNLIFIFPLFVSSISVGQIQKGKWNVGLGGGPLFELNSTGLNGGLFSIESEYGMTNSLIIGAKPYFAITNEKAYYAYDLTLKRPVGLHKDSFTSFGVNLELKFILMKTSLIRPYMVVLLGAGHSNYPLLNRNIWGELVADEKIDFINYNKGVGLGTYFQLTQSLSIDAKLTYVDVTANKKNIEASRYIYPTIGILKTF
jgi:hypothetical protein